MFTKSIKKIIVTFLSTVSVLFVQNLCAMQDGVIVTRSEGANVKDVKILDYKGNELEVIEVGKGIIGDCFFLPQKKVFILITESYQSPKEEEIIVIYIKKDRENKRINSERLLKIFKTINVELEDLSNASSFALSNENENVMAISLDSGTCFFDWEKEELLCFEKKDFARAAQVAFGYKSEHLNISDDIVLFGFISSVGNVSFCLYCWRSNEIKLRIDPNGNYDSERKCYFSCCGITFNKKKPADIIYFCDDESYFRIYKHDWQKNRRKGLKIPHCGMEEVVAVAFDPHVDNVFHVVLKKTIVEKDTSVRHSIREIAVDESGTILEKREMSFERNELFLRIFFCVDHWQEKDLEERIKFMLLEQERYVFGHKNITIPICLYNNEEIGNIPTSLLCNM